MKPNKHDDMCPCTRFRAQPEFCQCGAVERDEIVKDTSRRFGERLREIDQNPEPQPNVPALADAAMIDAAFKALPPDACGAIATGEMQRVIDAALRAAKDQSSSIIATFEAAYPDHYWHVAKGKITASEPLYGAIIYDIFGNEIGDGESDVSADEALRIAIEDAGLDIPAPQPRAPLTAGAAAKLSVFLEALPEWGCISNDERAVEILKFQQSGYDLSAYEEGR